MIFEGNSYKNTTTPYDIITSHRLGRLLNRKIQLYSTLLDTLSLWRKTEVRMLGGRPPLTAVSQNVAVKKPRYHFGWWIQLASLTAAITFHSPLTNLHPNALPLQIPTWLPTVTHTCNTTTQHHAVPSSTLLQQQQQHVNISHQHHQHCRKLISNPSLISLPPPPQRTSKKSQNRE